MSLNCRWDLPDEEKNCINAFFRGAASRPAGLPRYVGVPLQAAAGRATTIKLQT